MVPEIIEIPRHRDIRGNLSVVDSTTCLPFDLKRIFYIYDIPAGVERGGHAHYSLFQFLWVLSGTINIHTIDIFGKEFDWILQLPWQGLLIPPLTWASETSVSAGCVYAVGASEFYDSSDYIRDKKIFFATIEKTLTQK